MGSRILHIVKSKIAIAGLSAALFIAVCYLLVPPIFVLLIGSFTSTPPGAPAKFTLDTLSDAYGKGTIYRSLLNSLIFSTCVATSVLIVGCFLAWVAERTDAKVKSLINIFVLTPIMMPAMVLVGAWILLLSPKIGVINIALQGLFDLESAPFDIYSFSGLIWIGVIQELPLAFLWMWPAFKAMNTDFEEAALVSGAGLGRTLRLITIPLLRPSLISAWIIFFIYSFGSLSVPLMLGLPGRIFFYTTEIYLASMQIPTNLNIASAYSLLFLLMSVFGIYAYSRATSEAQRFVTVKGKGFRPRKIRLGYWQIPVIIMVSFLILVTVILPFLALAWNSLMPYPQEPSLRSLGLATLDNYRSAFTYGPAVRAITNSLVLGILAGVICTVFGLLIAWVVMRSKSPPFLKAALDQMATAPIAIPALLLGVGLTWFYLVIPGRIYGSLWILLIAYVTMHLPYAVRICSAGLGQLDKELEEAATIFGAGFIRTMSRVLAPILFPSIIASAVYVCLRSFREYAASLFLVAPGTEVYSVLIYNLWQNGDVNVMSAYATAVTGGLAVIIALGGIVRKGDQNND